MIELKIIAALLRDVSNEHGSVFNTRAARLTLAKVSRRLRSEGLSFITVAMPRLAKAFEKAIAGGTPLNSTKQGFKALPGSELPIFMGEFFQQVLDKDGTLLPNPCSKSVRVIREFLCLWYKYELPYTDEKEQKIVEAFKKAEDEIRTFTPMLGSLRAWFDESTNEFAPERRYLNQTWKRLGEYRRGSDVDLLRSRRGSHKSPQPVPGDPCPCGLGCTRLAARITSESRRQGECERLHLPALQLRDDGTGTNPLEKGVAPESAGSFKLPSSECYASYILLVRRARSLLSVLFSVFDPTDIYPRHGPGAVATKQRLWEKYQWSNIASGITDLYPIDAYFSASTGHVCDTYADFDLLGTESFPARVILVPKDSRGPRLISCEPVDYQWVQQGLGKAIVRHVERHQLTKLNVHFTDQGPNRMQALDGSYTGDDATLDLKEASDRISLDLVRLLFPEKLVAYLEACRTSSTVLPDKSILPLQKYAPMGSCLCFPVLALTVWAILAAGAPDEDTRKRILVYGDDVIVPTAYAGNAIEQLESFGLLVNRDKSCTSGLFRESCGMDAFQGDDVTPVRIRTVWSSEPRANVYTSWIAYANSFYDRQYYQVYNTIVEALESVYGPIPDESLVGTSAPSLRAAPEYHGMIKRRFNCDFKDESLQKLQYRVRVTHSPPVKHIMPGWSMLLRYFAESANAKNQAHARSIDKWTEAEIISAESSLSVSQYTRRDTSKLVMRWR